MKRLRGFVGRRLSSVGLKTESAEGKDSVAPSKRIEKLKKNFSTLYQKTGICIHDGGEQCRILKMICKQDGKEYIVKVQAKSRIRVGSEAAFRRMTEHMLAMPETEHVVNVYACYEDSAYFYTVQEACGGGDLHYYLSDLDSLTTQELDNEVRNIAKEMLLSLHQLHSQGLVHKDVKLENLVFKSGAEGKKLKLIDFDFVEEWEPHSPRSKSVVGTDGYIAPEAYLGDVCPKNDVFSAGVVLFTLVAARFPYKQHLFDDGPGENYVGSPQMDAIYTKLEDFKVQYGGVWDSLPNAREFVQTLLEFDPEKRPGAAEALRHPWLNARSSSARRTDTEITSWGRPH